MSCAPCSSDHALRSLPARKLGRCRACMRAARTGALTAWAATLGALALGASVPIVVGALSVAGIFSALLFAHAVAYAARSRPAPNASGGRLDRRAFVLGALAAAVLGTAGRARAQQPPERQECRCVIPDDGLVLRQSPDRTKNDEWEVCVDLARVTCDGRCPEERPGCLAEVVCTWDRKATKATGAVLRFPKKKNKRGVEEDVCCVVLTVGKCPATVHAEVEVTVQCFCGDAKIGDPCVKTLKADFTIECCCPKRFEVAIKREGDVDGSMIPGFDEDTQRAVLFSAPAVPNNARCTGGCTGGGACESKIDCQWAVDGDRGSKLAGDGKDCRRVVVVFDKKAGAQKSFVLGRTVTIACRCGETVTATCLYESSFKGP